MLAKYPGKSLAALVVLLTALALFSGQSFAEPVASITVLSPSGAPSDTLPEGDDYFTLVLGDPRDMDQRLDLRWQYLDVTNILAQNGLWTGYGGNNVLPLFPGMSGAANIGQTGQDFPIDGDRFNHFSIRARSSVNTTIGINYYTGPFSGGGSGGSGSLMAGAMHTLQWDTGWSGEIDGLRLSISGDPFVVDWIRLTDPSTSPVYTITWAASDVSWVNIYCDTDTNPSVLDHQIASWKSAGSGSHTWKTGYLAPGTYYIYIQDAQNSGTASYSPGPLTIQPAPIAKITAPSRASGDDYATEELNDPWDMSESTDVSFWSHLDSITFSNGQMHATTMGTDPYVHLRSAGKDTIEADYYKYLTWRLYVEGEWANSLWKLGGGSERWGVIRFFADTAGTWSVFNDVIPWEGWHVYQMDLSRGGGKYYLDGSAPPSDPGWNGLATTARLDLLEPYSYDRWPIHLDYVLLTADPRPSGGQYTIQWEILQGEPITTSLYYTTDPVAYSCDNGGTFIGQITPSGPLPPPGPFRVYLPLVMSGDVQTSSNAYTWNILPPAPGEYYVQILVDDGLSRVCWTSDAPLVIDP